MNLTQRENFEFERASLRTTEDLTRQKLSEEKLILKLDEMFYVIDAK